eukprot:5386460-Heterocapsa_arctica.AAC.1
MRESRSCALRLKPALHDSPSVTSVARITCTRGSGACTTAKHTVEATRSARLSLTDVFASA